MPRQLRQWLEGATYHTYSRCIELKPLMRHSQMKGLMLSVLRMALEKYNFELSGYTIMDNHFHFYIRTLKGGENISRIMQFIKSQFARRYNRMMGRTGPFWNERFGDSITELSKDPQKRFFETLFYIAFNPVRSRHVSDPRDYPYGSFRCYVEENYMPPVAITLHKYFMMLGNTFDERVEIFLHHERTYRNKFLLEHICQ